MEEILNPIVVVYIYNVNIWLDYFIILYIYINTIIIYDILKFSDYNP